MKNKPLTRDILCPGDDESCKDVQRKWICNENSARKLDSKPMCDIPKCRVICNPPDPPICNSY